MKSYIILPVVTLFSVFLVSCSKPEDKIVDHVEEIESIMQSNMDSPEDGVNELIEYFEKNGAEAAGQMVELGIELSKIEKEGDREERAKEVNVAFKTPMKNLEGTAEKFSKKVQSNKEATARMEEYAKRWESVFGTFSKLSGGGGLPF